MLLKASGGGTLYLPAGRYLVDKPIKIPSGVELRGSWDVQHHTQNGGTAIFTNYDGGMQEKMLLLSYNLRLMRVLEVSH